MRLDQLKERMGDAITITWRSFLLRAEPKQQDRAKFVAYTHGWARPAELEPGARFQPWSTTASPPASSLPAQLAFQAVLLADPDHADAVHRRLLEAYFAENRDISDNGELRTVVAEAGADITKYDAVLAEHRSALARQVIDEHNDAISQGITAVPTVVIDGVLPVPGAQSVDDYERWISRLTRYQEQTSQ